jgi:hypothetical protein
MGEAATQDRDVSLSTASLVKLVKMDLNAGESAGTAHYERAGRRLLLLKERIPTGKWNAWLKENFDLSPTSAMRYIKLAAHVESAASGGARAAPRTLSEGAGDHRPHHQAKWFSDARDRAREQTRATEPPAARSARAVEQRRLRERADEIIDAGYRAVAPRYHPDKPGGSASAMSEVNRARDKLRAAAKFF